MTTAEPDVERADVLLEKIAAESGRDQLSALLQQLRQLSTIPDCTVVLPLTRHRWWQVRHHAIMALAKCRDDRAEGALLAVLASPLDDYDRIYANASLGECGTSAAIPALADQIHHHKDDVKCSAIYALAKLGDASELPVFLDALTDRSWAAKWYAMQAIDQHGNEQAIAAVCARVRVILSRQRTRKQGSNSELILALKFLARFQHDHQAQATLTWVAKDRSAYLMEEESRWVREHGLVAPGQ